MNFFRNLLTRATRRQIIADMYDEPIVQPNVEPMPVQVPPVSNIPEPVVPKPTYTRNRSRKEELRRLRDNNKDGGFVQEQGYLGYSAMVYNSVLPAMKDGLRPHFSPGSMSFVDVLDSYETDPDFQSSFPAEWMEDDHWLPLLGQALKELTDEAAGQQTAPTVVNPGNAEMMQEPEIVAPMEQEQMVAFFDSHDPGESLPSEITQVPENLAAYLDMAKAREVSYIADLSAREELMKQEEMSKLRGIPPTELATAVFKNMIQDRPDRMEMLSGDGRFSELIDAWPLDLSEYVFKGVDGGVGERGEKDFRIRFFLEGGSEFAPPEVQQWMAEDDSHANPEIWDNYRELYNTHIDELSERILEIADPNIPMFNELGEEDGDLKVRAEEALWDFIGRKLRSKTMRRTKTEHKEGDQEGEDTGGLASQIAAKPQKADAARMSEEKQQEYMSALFGDFSSMATQIHGLAKDARDFLFNKFGREEMIQGKNGKSVTNSPFYAALTIDALGELGAEAMMGWKNLADSGQLTDEEIENLTQGKKITRSPRKLPEDITPEQMEEVNKNRSLGNLRYSPEAINNWSAIGWQSVVPPALALRRMKELQSGKLQGSEEDANSYRNIIPGLTGWRGRDWETLDDGKNSQSLVASAAQMIATELGDFLIDEAFQNYPKNVILAFLNTTKAFTGVSDFSRYAVYSGEVGESARKELLTDSVQNQLLSPESENILNQYLERQGIKPVGAPIETSHVEFIPDEIAYSALKERIARIKKEDYKQVPMPMWNSVANIMSLPEEYTMGTPSNAEQRKEWNARRKKDFGIANRKGKRAEAIYFVIKTAVSRLDSLHALKQSMSKFASTDIIDAQITDIQSEARAILREIERIA